MLRNCKHVKYEKARNCMPKIPLLLKYGMGKWCSSGMILRFKQNFEFLQAYILSIQFKIIFNRQKKLARWGKHRAMHRICQFIYLDHDCTRGRSCPVVPLLCEKCHFSQVDGGLRITYDNKYVNYCMKALSLHEIKLCDIHRKTVLYPSITCLYDPRSLPPPMLALTLPTPPQSI